jgi:hypothetical protein
MGRNASIVDAPTRERPAGIKTGSYGLGEILDLVHLLSLGSAQHFGMECGKWRSYCARLLGKI